MLSLRCATVSKIPSFGRSSNNRHFRAHSISISISIRKVLEGTLSTTNVINYNRRNIKHTVTDILSRKCMGKNSIPKEQTRGF